MKTKLHLFDFKELQRTKSLLAELDAVCFDFPCAKKLISAEIERRLNGIASNQKGSQRDVLECPSCGELSYVLAAQEEGQKYYMCRKCRFSKGGK